MEIQITQSSLSFLRKKVFFLGLCTPILFLGINLVTDMFLGFAIESRFPFGLYFVTGLVYGLCLQKHITMQEGVFQVISIPIVLGVANFIGWVALSFTGGNMCSLILKQGLIISLVLTVSFCLGLLFSKFELDR